MTLDEVDAVCHALPAVTMVVQWSDSNVYKVGGKVFAWASERGITCKASEIAYEAMVSEGRGCRAPYTQAGTHWLQLAPLAEQDTAEVASFLADAHRLMAAKLTKKARAELGL